jgi:hypothetical protein
MKAFKRQAHSVRASSAILLESSLSRIESSKVDGVRTYQIK